MPHALAVSLLVVLGACALVPAALALFSALVVGLVEAAIPPLGEIVEVDGAKIRVLDIGARDLGSRPAIVFVHGLSANMRNFTYALTDRLKGDFRLILLDRPGCGYSRPAPGAPPGLRAQATLIAGVIAALGLDRPLLVGHSLGGAVALALALDHPGTVGGLALIAPLSHPTEETPPSLRLLLTRSRLERRLIAWLLAIPYSIARSRGTLAQVFGPDPVPGDFGKRGGGLLELRPASFETASADLIAVGDELPAMVGRYPRLDLPVGVIGGDGDRLLDPAVQFRPLVAAVPGATLSVVEGAGHMLLLAHAEPVAAFVRAMAARVRR